MANIYIYCPQLTMEIVNNNTLSNFNFKQSHMLDSTREHI